VTLLPSAKVSNPAKVDSGRVEIDPVPHLVNVPGRLVDTTVPSAQALGPSEKALCLANARLVLSQSAKARLQRAKVDTSLAPAASNLARIAADGHPDPVPGVPTASVLGAAVSVARSAPILARSAKALLPASVRAEISRNEVTPVGPVGHPIPRVLRLAAVWEGPRRRIDK